MSSSTKTKNLKLSQYKTTDHPSYINDYNSDMQKIDAYATSNDTAISGLVKKQELETMVVRISQLESEINSLKQTVNAIPSTYMPLNPPAKAFDPAPSN